MGGRLTIDVTVARDGDAAADAPVGGIARRIEQWAGHLTRFDGASQLTRLNLDPRSAVPVGPTMARVLAWAAEATSLTGGLVDATLLAERLAAEAGTRAPLRPDGGWWLERRGRLGVVHRPPGLRFDLDGIAKGWLADRALRLLDGWAGAIVDADGDMAIRLAPGDEATIGIADPACPDALLTALRLDGATWSQVGIATSGTSVHRWPGGRHHLIDPRTGLPATTDVVQATVVAASAAEAEALAKTAVILGLAAGAAFLEARGALAAVLVTQAGDVVAIPTSLPWLAAA